MKGNELLQKMDAKVWAEEFVKLHGGDEGLMLSWFANAIMCGHDHAGSKVEKQARAEVLAGAIAAQDLEELLSRSYRAGATSVAAWVIKLLHRHPEDPPEMGCQPEAISEKLEELLREEREKGLELANLIYGSDSNFLLTDETTRAGRMESYDTWNKIFAEAINIRVHEKEKARAAQEKP